LIQAPGETGNSSVKFQLQQHRRYLFGRQAGSRDESVNIARIETHFSEEHVIRAGVSLGRRGRESRSELLQHILSAFHQFGTLLDEGVTAL